MGALRSLLMHVLLATLATPPVALALVVPGRGLGGRAVQQHRARAVGAPLRSTVALTEDASTDAPPPSPKASLLGLFRERRDDVLACPVSLAPLNVSTDVLGGVARRTFQCSEFGTRYADNGIYVDLAPRNDDDSQAPWWSPQRSQAERVQTDLFRLPTVSFLYERGWRQNFENAGFPGIDAEFEEVSRFFAGEDDGAPAGGAGGGAEGARSGVVLDLSCGSGLMTRRLARSARYERVIAADFSESMLLEARRRFSAGSQVGAGLSTPQAFPNIMPPTLDDALRLFGGNNGDAAADDAASAASGEEGALPRAEWPLLLRADAARLPVASGALDAVHAGACLHCWPRIDEALREVWRSLAPGGRFFATTFLYSDLLPPGATRASRSGNGFRVFELDELRELMLAAGFEADAIDVRKEGRGCAIIRCTKAAAVAVAATEDEAESESKPAAAPAEEEEKKLPLEERAADVARWKAAPDDEE